MIYTPNIFDANEDVSNFLLAEEMEWPIEFGKYSRFYHIATESVKDYMQHMNSNIDNALTVGASADQGIALTNNGAKNVYFFDINKADYYYIILKKYALMYLKRQEFLDFIIGEKNKNIMEYRLYKKLENVLPKSVKLFWDKVYNTFNYRHDLMAYYLFRSPNEHSKVSRKINDYYINNNSYYETQNKVKNSNWYFIESDFYDLHKTIPSNINFDSIVLSNIYEYLNFGGNVSLDKATKYISYIKNTLIPKLNNNGNILLSYFYRYNDDINSFIESSLKNNPNGWVRSDGLFSLDKLEAYTSGYTSQNVAYYYLLKELVKTLDIEKITTTSAGYGISSANTDLALIYKKTL